MLVKAKNGKSYAISDEVIDKMVESLDISIQEAVDLWLEDSGAQTNEEQEQLDKKAKKDGYKLSNSKADTPKEKKPSKPRNVNTSDEKKELFQNILENIQKTYEKVTILNENKLIEVKIGEKTFKIDIIECRNKKK